MPLPETFRAAIEKGVRDIKGKLDKLNADEKRQLLADLREREDCPEGWKNIDPKETTKHTQMSAQCNRETFEPRESKELQRQKHKRRIENGKAQEYAKKIKENGQQKNTTPEYNADPINKEKKAKYT